MNSIMTYRFKKQLRQEAEAADRGEIVRAPGSGLLPVEVKEAASRKPLGMGDLRLAIQIGGCGLGQFPIIVGKIMNGPLEGEWEEYHARKKEDEARKREEEQRTRERLAKVNGMVQGINGHHGLDDEFEEDEDEDYGWEGGSARDRAQLNALLDECLANGQ